VTSVRDDAAITSATSTSVVPFTAAVLVAVALAAALSVDVIRAGSKVKSDEATYVAMTLSLAYDGNLSYERRDLERFWGLYQEGPDGIFLKKGKRVRLRADLTPPFIHLLKTTDPRTDRLYFGKAMIYSVVAAPFVRGLGMNGFLVLHVLLLFVVCACGYRFLRALSPPGPALGFTLAFVGAAVVPVYAIFLMPDLFNFALVFVAYFVWLYKEVAVPRVGFLRGVWSDLLSAALLGAVSYSKLTNAPLIAPLVLLLFWRRQRRSAIATGAVFVLVTCAFFGANALITGEFNYQGGDRKTFYGSFPFESSSRDVWNERAELVTTNDSDAANVLAPSEFLGRFGHNVEYFVIGRHFGFVPYFFPGAIVLVAWASSRDRFRAWRVLALVGLGLAVLMLLIFFPYTWSGGGGPPGNRYFLSLYPVLFFVMPPVRLAGAALVSWIGGALFTAKILINPFVSAKNTWEIAERGFARRLPIELTMAQDLPLMLAQPPRGRIPYGHNPEVLLYFLDTHAYPPEPVGTASDGYLIYAMWVSGSGRADIIVRSERQLQRLNVTAESPIRTLFTVAAGGPASTRSLAPGQPQTFSVAASGVRGLGSYAYLLTALSKEAFTPHVRDPHSNDVRNLSVMMRFQAVEAP
jgi:hypothetical protein